MIASEANNGPVALAGWHAEIGAMIAGSLYAVDTGVRTAAATALTEAGCAVHVDLIIDAAGNHIGVNPNELTDLLAHVPAAMVDVHLMFADDAVGAPSGSSARVEASRVLATLIGQNITHVTVDRAMFDLGTAAVGRLRTSGIAVWLELPPNDTGMHIPAQADGLLVMFIRSGTTEPADPRCLDKIPSLAERWNVGVDGGVTASLARAAADAGARYIVSGRALLRLPPDIPKPTREVKP